MSKSNRYFQTQYPFQNNHFAWNLVTRPYVVKSLPHYIKLVTTTSG